MDKTISSTNGVEAPCSKRVLTPIYIYRYIYIYIYMYMYTIIFLGR